MNDRTKGRLILGAMCLAFVALPLWLADWSFADFREAAAHGFKPEPAPAYILPVRCVTDTDCEMYAETSVEPAPVVDDISTAALVEWTRQSIRAHGPVRRNCVKRQHGFVVPENWPAEVDPAPTMFHHHEPVIESPLPDAAPPMLAEVTEQTAQDYTGLPPAYFFERIPRTEAPVQVPEPGSLGLFGLALCLGAIFRRKVLP